MSCWECLLTILLGSLRTQRYIGKGTGRNTQSNICPANYHLPLEKYLDWKMMLKSLVKIKRGELLSDLDWSKWLMHAANVRTSKSLKHISDQFKNGGLARSAHNTHRTSAMALSLPSPVSLQLHRPARQTWLRRLRLSSRFRSGVGVVLARVARAHSEHRQRIVQLWAEPEITFHLEYCATVSAVDPDPSSERRYSRWELVEAFDLRPWENWASMENMNTFLVWNVFYPHGDTHWKINVFVSSLLML